MSIQNTEAAVVDYDFPPVAELELADVQYRVDVGMRSAVAVSGRALGSWTWQLLAEGRWDGVKLKASGVDREVIVALEKALRAATAAE